MFMLPIRRKTLPTAYKAPPARQRRLFNLGNLWRKMRLRAAHAKQLRHLKDVTVDPHMAKDIGLPVTQPERPRFGMW